MKNPKIGVGVISNSLGGDSDVFVNSKSLLLNNGTADEYVNCDSMLTKLATTTKGGFSLRFKVSDTAPSAVGTIISFGDTDADSYIRVFLLTDGRLRFELRMSGVTQWRTTTNTAAPLVNNVWHHLAFAQNSFAGKIYVDSEAPSQTVSDVTDAAIWFDDIPGLDNGRLGCQDINSLGNAIFIDNANFDELIGVDVLYSASTVLDVYNLGEPKDETSIVNGLCYYRMGDNPDDNYNSDNAGEWTFKNQIGSAADIFTVNCEEADVELDVAHNQVLFSPQFNNSISYGSEINYFKRSTDSEYEFTYSGTYLRVQASVTGTDDEVAVFENGTYTQTLTMVDGVIKIATLTAGAKTVKLVEGRVRTTSLSGVRLNSIVVDDNAFVKVDDGNTAERFVFLGDSITQGNQPTNHFTLAYAQLFKYTDSKQVTVLGFGGAKLEDLASTPAKISTTNSWISSSFQDTTTTKKLIIMLGTNDFLNSVTPANYKTYYEDLLDTINVADSSIVVYCISPLDNSTADANLTQYDTNVSDVCSSRAWATYIDGLSILNYPTGFNDAVHPDTSGHLAIHDFIDGIIL